MRYMLLLHYPEMGTDVIGEEAIAAGQAAFASYAAALQAAGALIAAEVLKPSQATTTITHQDGVPRIQDGPFADTKEQLGGVFIIEAAHLDAAMDWAAKAPSAQWGAVEIRPVATHTVAGVWTP